MDTIKVKLKVNSFPSKTVIVEKAFAERLIAIHPTIYELHNSVKDEVQKTKSQIVEDNEKENQKPKK